MDIIKYVKTSVDVVNYFLDLIARLFEYQYDKINFIFNLGSYSDYDLNSQMYTNLALRYSLNFKYDNFA